MNTEEARSILAEFLEYPRRRNKYAKDRCIQALGVLHGSAQQPKVGQRVMFHDQTGSVVRRVQEELWEVQFDGWIGCKKRDEFELLEGK